VLVHADRGLASLVVTQASNASVSLPTFAHGSTDTLLVTATKLDQSTRSTFTIRATDQTGAARDCDPALVTVGQGPGERAVQVLHHLVKTESHVTLTNNTPGVDRVRLVVNGHRFELANLRDGETRTLDVSSAMRTGTSNTLVVVAHGRRGSSAVVLVSDA
jgi:hypothetical protein